VLLYFTDPAAVRRHLDREAVSGHEVVGLLRARAIPAGTPVLLDEVSMRPVEPWCSWFRHLAYHAKAAKTMREYAYILLRLADFLAVRERTRCRHRVGPGLPGAAHPGPAAAGRGRDVGQGGPAGQPAVPVAGRARACAAPAAAAGRRSATVPPRISRWPPGMRPRQWSTVLLPELGVGVRRPGEPVELTLQACAKYGTRREVFVPAGALDAVETFLLAERPEIVAASARTLARRRRELFVVTRIDRAAGRLHGLLDGRRRVFAMPAMDTALRRITVRETDAGLEPLAVFVGHGGWMLGPSSWARIRYAAWKRMGERADERPPVMPARVWRWHDLRHTHALQLLAYLEARMDGEATDAVARRRRHVAYLGGRIARNPLLVVSRRLGHASPASTYAYLRYADDASNCVEQALAGWTAHADASYAEIGAHAFGLHRAGDGGAG
jgi:integrase